MLPDIYLYNPTTDFAIANGSPYWQPNRLLQKMGEDLETLPVYLSSENDFILVTRKPSLQFIENLEKLGIRNRKFVNIEDLKKELNLKECLIKRLCPWGWNPAIHRFLQPLKQFCTDEFKISPVFNWNESLRSLFSRKFAARFLTEFISNNNNSILIQYQYMPVECRNQPEIEDCLVKWGKLMIKAPWSSSGRGLQKITKNPVHPSVWQRIGGIIHDQGFVMVEPFLDKQADLAFEFQIKNKRILFEGMSYFLTDSKGQYQGNILNGLPDNLQPAISCFIKENIDWLMDEMKNLLSASTLPHFYEGYLGIDAMIFRDKDQQYRINPCLEINLRYTMGILSLQLEKLVSSHKKGMFNLFFRPGISFNEFSKKMTDQFPPHFQDTKLCSGFFPLTDLKEGTQFGAYILVNEES